MLLEPMMQKLLTMRLHGMVEALQAQEQDPAAQELSFLERLIELGIEQGTFVERDPTIAALMTTSMIIGPLLISQMPGLSSKENMRRLESEAVETTMRYLTGND